MSFSNGTFSINSTGQPVVTGTVISSTAFNALTADLATGLSTCVLKDGTQTITANIPMSTYKLTGLGAGTASGHSVRYEQINGVVTTAGDIIYASGAGAFSRLAIGTAYQRVATNAGATAPEWVSDSQNTVVTTAGDTLYATANRTIARLPASASVAAHATTSDVWTASETILTGTAVTFTDIADAPYAGAVAWVYMNATHTWTDGAVFDVQGGANYTAAIGDWVRINAVTVSTFDVTIFKADGTAVVGSNKIIQIVNTQTGAVATGTTTIPFDDTVPQNTEGDQYLSLAITPTNAANLLRIEVEWVGSNSAVGGMTLALFQDSTASALAATHQRMDQTAGIYPIGMSHYMTAGTTSATTFKIRAGLNNAGTTAMNGNPTRQFGGALASSITITEIAA